MPKITSGFNRTSNHRRQNFSMDIKNINMAGVSDSPFLKKYPKQKIMFNMKHHFTSNTSMDAQKQLKNTKRRFSLTKTPKNNHFISYTNNIDSHLITQKLSKIEKLMAEENYLAAIPIIRQLLIKDESNNFKNQLYLMYAQCLQKCERQKQADQYLTKYLSTNCQSYGALFKRGKIRCEVGAKQLGIKDLKNSIKIDPRNPQAYLYLSYVMAETGNEKDVLNILLEAINRSVQSLQIILKAIEVIILNKKIISSPQQKLQKLQKSFYSLMNEKLIPAKSEKQCLKGLICESKEKVNEASIYFEECLKYNSSKQANTIAIEHLLHKKINQRDYYSAYHTTNRKNVLYTDQKYLQGYGVFLDGVILSMKKKYIQSIKIHQKLLVSMERSVFAQSNEKNRIKVHYRAKKLFQPLIYKFLAYSHFKAGNHEKSVFFYEKLSPFGHDQCSSYNLLLAQGIIAVEKNYNFQLGMQKFDQSKYIYSTKTQPYIYTAMTIIYREISLSKKSIDKIEKSQLLSAVVHAIQEMNEANELIISSSSNLLFHRSLLNLFIGEYSQALNDINLCIQKAQQNQPKYFYLRGLCYSIVRQLSKAANEYSISLSLSNQYYESLLQRAKCFFLLGQTENGFNDLKIYMRMNPDDYSVHKWIGDLLFEGYSYYDALKAYQEIDEGLSIEAEFMKAKCMVRVSEIQNIYSILIKISKNQECDHDKIRVDLIATSLLRMITKPFEKKDLIKKIKQLNSELEKNNIGNIFDLIDCMNILGLGSLYVGNYEEAYQSFLLTAQLFPSLQQKNASGLKSDILEQNFSLSSHDIYLNIAIALLGMKSMKEALTILQEEFSKTIITQSYQKYIQKIIKNAESDNRIFQTFNLENQTPKNDRIKLRPIQLKLYSLKLKCTPTFSMFHKYTQDLYSQNVISKIVKNLHPSYIDNMPEGPWIKRNEHGVIFTDNLIEEQIGSSLISSMRDAKIKKNDDEESDSYISSQQSSDFSRENFKKILALDPKVEKKLNSILTNRQQKQQK